jgi:hypothetical protein
MARNNLFDDVVGFVIGFLFGCCGIVLAAVLARQDYLRGALLGFATRFGLGLVVGLLAESSGGIERLNPDGSDWVRDVPWELVAAFGIGTVFVLGTIAGAIWAFGGRGDDDDDEPPPPESREYVTFSRR